MHGDYFARRRSNPPLLPLRGIAQLSPFDPDLLLGVHRLEVNPHQRSLWQFRLDHLGDEKVLVLVHGLDGRPLGEKQFLGVQCVHIRGF